MRGAARQPRSEWELVKGSSPESGERAPQGSGHGPRLLEFKERLDNALIRWVWVLGGSVCSTGLETVITVSPFQLRISQGVLPVWL